MKPGRAPSPIDPHSLSLKVLKDSPSSLIDSAIRPVDRAVSDRLNF